MHKALAIGIAMATSAGCAALLGACIVLSAPLVAWVKPGAMVETVATMGSLSHPIKVRTPLGACHDCAQGKQCSKAAHHLCENNVKYHEVASKYVAHFGVRPLSPLTLSTHTTFAPLFREANLVAVCLIAHPGAPYGARIWFQTACARPPARAPTPCRHRSLTDSRAALPGAHSSVSLIVRGTVVALALGGQQQHIELRTRQQHPRIPGRAHAPRGGVTRQAKGCRTRARRRSSSGCV